VLDNSVLGSSIRSAPVWGRGLKSIRVRVGRPNPFVGSRVGPWIEITTGKPTG